MLYGHNCGFLYEKLRNKARKQVHLPDENGNGTDRSSEHSGGDSNFDELLQFLKNYVVTEQIDDLKAKMAESVNYRRRILANPPEPIYKMFGFYFVDPRLVNIFIFFILLWI